MRQGVKITLAAAIAATALALALLGYCFLTPPPLAEGEVVFVSQTRAPVAAVAVGDTVGQNADNTAMTRGDSIGFDGMRYPVTVTAYGDLQGNRPLASLTIWERPEGERWYVRAEDGPEGVVLRLSGQEPAR